MQAALCEEARLVCIVSSEPAGAMQCHLVSNERERAVNKWVEKNVVEVGGNGSKD